VFDSSTVNDSNDVDGLAVDIDRHRDAGLAT
jgi:hypothetical protein